LSAIGSTPPVNRYEHEAPGDTLDLDIKKQNRLARPGHRMNGDLRTQMYRPRTNRKAARLIWTALHEWAYAQSCRTPTSAPRICRINYMTTTGIGRIAA